MRPPKELYTPESLFSLAGSCFVVWIATGIARQHLGWHPWLVALAFSEFLALVGLATLPPEHWKRYGTLVLLSVAFCNGLLIYSQATAVNAIQTAVPSKATTAVEGTLFPSVDPVPWWPPAQQSQAARDAADILSSGALSAQRLGANLTDLGAPIRNEIQSLEHDLDTIRQNRAATQRGLQSGDQSERASLETNLTRLDVSEKETAAKIAKLKVAALVIDDPVVTAVLVKNIREQLLSSQETLATAAAQLKSVWGPVWQSAPFKPTKQQTPE